MPIPEELKFTYEDYVCFPDDGKRHEIIDGEHFMTPAPQTRHQIVSANLERVLANYVVERDAGYVLHAPIDVVLSDTTVVQPDILFVSGERRGIIKRKFIEGPPDLIVEIISPAYERQDRQIKMKHYALLGAPEYWLLDFEARTLEQYVREGDLFQRAGVFAQSFAPAIFPGLTIDLSQIFKGPGF